MERGRCNRCKKTKVKIAVGGKSGEYQKCVDESGRAWLRNTCPPCRYGTQKRVRRRQAILELNETDPLTDRLCRECSKPLPQSRYFHHKECDDKAHASEGQGFYTAEDWGYESLGHVSEPLNFKISEMNLLGAT